MAARAQHVAERIQPALQRGEVVLSDRYIDSTLVYQGAARNLAIEELILINRFATLGVVPDLTILLDGEVGLLGNRLADRGSQDRIELEDASFHQKVRQGFLELAAAQPERIKRVVTAGGIETVHQAVVKQVVAFITRRNDNEG